MRRLGLVLFLVLASCGPGEATVGSVDSSGGSSLARPLGSAHLRLMAGNLTAGTRQSYTAEGIRLFQAAQPDVALIQEFNVGGNSSAELRGFVDEAFGADFQFARGTGQIPNGVVSRFPIVAHGEWVDPYVSNRTFTWARIDVPGDADLWAVSLHLLTRSASVRQSEAQALVALITAAVPAGDLLVVGGDLNTSTRGESALGELAAVVQTAGPWPTDVAGDGDTNSTRSKPYDWVLVSPGLAAHQVPTVLDGAVGVDGLVLDTRVTAPPPTLATDSAALNMQHMGVLRDFELSDPVAPAEVRLDEVLANEPGSLTSGEFIELLNTGGSAADLSGWTLSDAAAVRHRFPSGTVLLPGARLYVMGATASTGGLSLNNGGDRVVVADANGAVVDSLTYASSLASQDGVSMQWTSSGFVLHTQVSARPCSPGEAP